MLKPETVFGVRVTSRKTLQKLGFKFDAASIAGHLNHVPIGSEMDQRVVDLVNASREIQVRQGGDVEDYMAPDDVLLGTMIGWWAFPGTDNKDTMAYYTDLITIQGIPTPFANLVRLNRELAVLTEPPIGQTTPTVTGWMLSRVGLHYRLTYNVWYS